MRIEYPKLALVASLNQKYIYDESKRYGNCNDNHVCNCDRLYGGINYCKLLKTYQMKKALITLLVSSLIMFFIMINLKDSMTYAVWFWFTFIASIIALIAYSIATVNKVN